MKKINAKLILVLLICVLFLVGCSKVSRYKTDSSEDQSEDQSMFVLIEKIAYGWSVVYHKDTKVMYAVSNGIHNNGTFTLLVDAQGKPMLWEEN